MNIEEKAKEYRSNTFGIQFSNDIAMAFSEGAKWMLEKACEYKRSQYPYGLYIIHNNKIYR